MSTISQHEKSVTKGVQDGKIVDCHKGYGGSVKGRRDYVYVPPRAKDSTPFLHNPLNNYGVTCMASGRVVFGR